MKEKLRALGDRWRWLGSVLDVQERMREVNGGFVAAAINVTTFVAMFPLALVAIAVLGFLAHGDPDVPARIVDALGLTGTAATLVEDTLDTASASRQAASVIGVLGLAWAGSAVAVALQRGVRTPWQERSEGTRDRLIGMAWLAVAGLGFAVTIAVGGLLNFLPDGLPAPLVTVLTVALALLAEVGLFWWLFWGLGSRRVPPRDLLPGAVLAGLSFEVLKLVGTVYLPRLIAHSSALYGSLGVVFAILAWLAVFARLVVWCSALNAVRYEQRAGTVEVAILVPRLPGPTPTGADRGGAMVTGP